MAGRTQATTLANFPSTVYRNPLYGSGGWPASAQRIGATVTAARGAQPVRLTVVVRGLNLREETHSAAAEAVQRLVAELLGDPPAAGAAASLATEVLGYWRSQPSCRWAVRVSWTAEVRDAVWRRKYRLAGTGVSISAWSETAPAEQRRAASTPPPLPPGSPPPPPPPSLPLEHQPLPPPWWPQLLATAPLPAYALPPWMYSMPPQQHLWPPHPHWTQPHQRLSPQPQPQPYPPNSHLHSRPPPQQQQQQQQPPPKQPPPACPLSSQGYG